MKEAIKKLIREFDERFVAAINRRDYNASSDWESAIFKLEKALEICERYESENKA